MKVNKKKLLAGYEKLKSAYQMQGGVRFNPIQFPNKLALNLKDKEVKEKLKSFGSQGKQAKAYLDEIIKISSLSLEDIQKIPLEKQQALLRFLVELSEPSYDQISIIAGMHRYRREENQNIPFVNPLGNCSGLSEQWLYYFTKNELAQYYRFLRILIRYAKSPLHSLKHLIQEDLASYPSSSFTSVEETNRQLSEFIKKIATSQNANEYDNSNQQAYMKRSGFIWEASYLLIYEEKKAIESLEKQLESLLKDKEDEALVLTKYNHAINLVKKGNQFYVYDSNDAVKYTVHSSLKDAIKAFSNRFEKVNPNPNSYKKNLLLIESYPTTLQAEENIDNVFNAVRNFSTELKKENNEDYLKYYVTIKRILKSYYSGQNSAVSTLRDLAAYLKIIKPSGRWPKPIKQALSDTIQNIDLYLNGKENFSTVPENYKNLPIDQILFKHLLYGDFQAFKQLCLQIKTLKNEKKLCKQLLNLAIQNKSFLTANFLLERYFSINNYTLQEAEQLCQLAIEKEDEAIFRLLTSHFASYLTTSSFEKLIDVALQNGNQKVIATLLKINPNCGKANKEKIQKFAIEHDKLSLLHWLDSNQLLDLTVTYPPYDMDCLEIAAIKGYTSTVKFILDKKKEINKAENLKSTPLHYAAASGNYTCFKLIAETRPEILHQINEKKDNCLHIAAMRGHYDLINNFIDDFATHPQFNSLINQPNQQGDTPLHLILRNAKQEGKSYIIKRLVEKGTNINIANTRGFLPLHLAGEGQDKASFKYLLSCHEALSTPPNTFFKNHLNLSYYMVKHLSLAEIKPYRLNFELNLLETGSKRNYLHYACLGANTEVIDEILKSNPHQCTYKDIYGQLPIHYYPLEDCSLKTFKKLWVPEEINTKDYNQMSLVFKAALCKNKEVFHYLIDQGADISGQYYNKSLLEFAIELNDVNLVQKLIEKGADVNEKSKCHETPLHVAVKQRNSQIVELLLENGAIPKKNGQGQKPHHLINDWGYQAGIYYQIHRNDDLLSNIISYGILLKNKIFYGISKLSASTQIDNSKNIIINDEPVRAINLPSSYKQWNEKLRSGESQVNCDRPQRKLASKPNTIEIGPKGFPLNVSSVEIPASTSIPSNPPRMRMR